MQSVTLGDMGKAWLQLQFVRVRAAGELSPRLYIEMQARSPLEKTYVQLHHLRGKLHFANELIGEGFLSGGEFSSHDNGLTLEVPLTREALHYVADRIAAERVELRLDLSGWLHVRWEAAENEPHFMQSPEPGEWGFVTFGQSTMTALMIQVARSDWFKNVMEPVGTLGYVVTEIPLPKGSAASSFAASLNHLGAAEERYAVGDDPGVFARCRAAVEALPGYPKSMVGSIADEDKAKSLDAVLKEGGDYLHRGRHVAQAGDQKGEFPVDHADARFALTLTRLLVSEVARLSSDGFRSR